MDKDLEEILTGMWKLNPYADFYYLKVKTKLLLIQELRNLQKIIDLKLLK